MRLTQLAQLMPVISRLHTTVAASSLCLAVWVCSAVVVIAAPEVVGRAAVRGSGERLLRGAVRALSGCCLRRLRSAGCRLVSALRRVRGRAPPERGVQDARV